MVVARPYQILLQKTIFGHFPIEIPIEVQQIYGQRKEWSQNENKNCSEISEQNGTFWNHVKVEEIKFSQ